MQRINVGGRRLAFTLGALCLVLTACASDGDLDGASGTTTSTAASQQSVEGGGAGAWERPPCDHSPSGAPETMPVADSDVAVDLVSFDGTTIRANWFPVPDGDGDAPVVLMGPGWSLPGDTDPDTVGVFGALNISSLNDAGFHVLTWDPRGFGSSGGQAQVNDPKTEGRDVSVLLDWVADQPSVLLDAPGDPRIGMVGGSYGGGIQLVAAAVDCRIDALVPIIAWHSLRTSLFKADTPKLGWSTFLVEIAGEESVAPEVTAALEAGQANGAIDPALVEWFEARGPAAVVADITAPTLLVHGTVDTLFTLDEAVTNYELLRDAGVPVSMLWYCGGHGTCLTEEGDIDRLGEAAIDWLRRWVLLDDRVDLGPSVQLIDQHGTVIAADGYPLESATAIEAAGSGQLDLVAEGGSGPLEPTDAGDADDILRGLVLPITPARAANAVEVTIDVPDDPTLVVGAPLLELTYYGTAPAGERPTRVFAQLVDEATGFVIGNQVTPVEVVLDGEVRTTRVPLEIIAHRTDPGVPLTLQLVATTVAYAEPRLGGRIEVEFAHIELPTVQVPEGS
ncbi:MAG: alpha/beta fold hydrolase [Acidimicrobiia bacterium]|nr:alpha/beta fold hydrolase [Acidimicrobiia bacterium]